MATGGSNNTTATNSKWKDTDGSLSDDHHMDLMIASMEKKAKARQAQQGREGMPVKPGEEKDAPRK